MERNQEFDALLGEPLPDALEGSVRRAGARYRKSKLGRWCGIPVASLAGVAAAFILLVNTSIPFARACGNIPFLKELAATVAFSPSLKAAVENNYLQPVGLTQTDGDVTMTVEYLIVDQKQVNIFFSLKSETSPGLLHGDPDIRTEEGEGFGSVSYGANRTEKGELNYVTVDFFDSDVPDALTFGYRVVDGGTGWDSGPVPAKAPDTAWDGEQEEYDPDYIAEFSFLLRLDPAFTEVGDTYALNRPFELDGQQFTAESVSVYPSHIEFNVVAAPGNTAALKGLRFYLTDETGRKYESISNGITAFANGDTPNMTSYRLESSYFDRAEHLTIHITGATWLDVGREFVAVDIKNSKALSPMPEGVELLDVTRVGSRVKVRLAARLGGEDGTAPVRTDSYSVSNWEYRDPEGGEHSFNSMSTTSGFRVNGEHQRADGVPEGYFAEEFYLPDYPWDTVELGMYHSRYSTFEGPIEIAVK